MTSFQIYSIIFNIENFVKGKDINIFTIGNAFYYNNRMKEYFKKQYKRIYNEVENNYYNINELAMFCLYNHVVNWTNNKTNLFDIKQKNVLNFLQQLKEKRMNEDLETLKLVKKQFEFKNWKDFVKPMEDGTNVIYVLLKNERISVLTFEKFYKKLLTLHEENDILISEEVKRCGRISCKITQIFNSNRR